MTAQIEVRKARLSDAERIADFVNSARAERQVSRMDVAERFSQVGFLLAEQRGKIIGMAGWRVEKLVICLTDFLVAPGADRLMTGRALVAAMEKEGEYLQAEVSFLFLPANPSQELIDYWQQLAYTRKAMSELPKAWREASKEWNPQALEAMIKQIREDLIRKPM
jgi:N-acetylglutamate synthase-like GNAT family acetyltransferase